MLLAAIPLSVSAEPEANGDVEVILLFDTSGSMNKSDPDKNGVRLSVEAAYQFVFNYPTNTNMFITVIPFDSYVYEGFKRVNVKDEKGRAEFSSQMDALMSGQVGDFKFWENNTDTGTALEVAKKKLDASSVSKKAVILFTDGKIALTSKDNLKDEESVAKALENSAALRDSGIHVYSIGLNCNGEVDKAQLESISGEEDVRIVNSAADLSGMFTEVYTELFENSYLDDNTDEFEVSPDVESVCDVRIYGQAVKEANISLSSGAPLHRLVVTAPNGFKVADIDFRNPSAGKIDGTYCVIQNTPSAYTATIKLIEPMDGNWSVKITGEKSTVITRKIYLFDLEARTDITAPEYYIGDTFEYTAAIYNSVSGTHLTSTGLYDKNDGGEAVVNVTRKGVSGQTPYMGELNASQNGYVFKIDFKDAGEYTLATTIKHAQFETTATNTIKVVGPKVAIDNKVADGKFTVNASFVHPVTSAPLTELPNYLLSRKVTFSVVCNGKEVHSVTSDISAIKDGKYNFEYAPSESGKFEIVAKLSSGEEYKSAAVDFKAPEKPKVEIKLEGDLPDDVSKRGFSGSFEKEISLKDVFKLVNSKEALSYSVKVEGDDSFTATVDGDVLKIKSEGFGEAKLILTVSADGASYSHEIELAAKSLWPVIIIIFVLIILVIVIIIVAIIVIRKKQIISIAFKFKVEDRSVNAFNPTFVVYEVSRLSNKKNAKPSMTIAQILNSNGYAQMEMGGTMDPQAFGMFMDQYAGRITLTGVPFKKAFKIVYKSADGKTRNATFKQSNVVVRLSETCDITFGNSHANL